MDGFMFVRAYLRASTSEQDATRARKQVEAFAEGFPLFPERRNRNLAGVRG